MAFFLDTNVLVYALSTHDPRRITAESLVSAGGAISAQVLNEVTSVTSRKLGWTWPEIEAAIALLRDACNPVLALTATTHAAAMALARDHRLHFYDALIIASAIEAGCETLLTEDMQHDRRIAGLTIINPFL